MKTRARFLIRDNIKDDRPSTGGVIVLTAILAILIGASIVLFLNRF